MTRIPSMKNESRLFGLASWEELKINVGIESRRDAYAQLHAYATYLCDVNASDMKNGSESLFRKGTNVDGAF